MQGPFYIVNYSRDDPQARWISAEFSKRRYAEDFAGDVGGTIHSPEDEGMGELVERWRRHDYGLEAHVEAIVTLVESTNELHGLVVTLDDVELVEAYADTDPACAAVFRLAAIAAEASSVLEEFIPPGTEKLEGVSITEVVRRRLEGENDPADANLVADLTS